MRYWLSGSALILLSGIVSNGNEQIVPARDDANSGSNSEWKLAGVLPGHSTFQRAKAILGDSFFDSSVDSATWTTCVRELVVRAYQKGMVTSVSVSRISDGGPMIDCFGAASGELKWVTGLGLRLDDSKKRVMQLYGQPDSRSPSTKGDQQLELLHYKFDRADQEVPLVMEVVCTLEKAGKPGRVVEITLAVASQ